MVQLVQDVSGDEYWSCQDRESYCFFVDLMTCWTCSTVTWNSSSSVRCLVFLSMMQFILLVLWGVEFTNCLLKDCAMLSDLDLSLLLNCSSVWLTFDFPARKSNVFQYLYVFVLW